MTTTTLILPGTFFIVCGLFGQTVPLVPSSTDVRAEFEAALQEFDQAQSNQAQQPDRARRLFRSAAQRFGSIRAAGVRNGHLEFNLANCLLQAGDVGRAILHYRRAERSIPGDPLLADNLSVARSRCLTNIRPTAKSTFLQNTFFWHYRTSLASRIRGAFYFYSAVWALLLLRHFVRRRFISVSVIICGVLAVVTASSVAASYWADRNIPEGVITSLDVVVSKGPGEGYHRLFEQPLQPGVEFTLRNRSRSGWWKIELADGKSGWIRVNEAELIPEQAG